MKLPVLHNFKVIRGEHISLAVGYNLDVPVENLFACIRKYPQSNEKIAQFEITISHDNLAENELCEIQLSLDTLPLEVGVYYWDLFLWNAGKPYRCLVQGQVKIVEGVSNRGK